MAAIIAISDIADEALRRGRLFTVHSVYRNTVNLSGGDRLLSLVTANSVRTPLSIVTDLDAFDTSLFENGTAVRCEDGSLRFPDALLERTGSCSLFSTQITGGAVSAEKLLLLEQELLSALRQHMPEGSMAHAVLDEEDFSHPLLTGIDEAQKILSEASAYYSQGAVIAAASGLAGLLGLGIGLTPSGDDFLTGALLGMRMVSSKRVTALREKLEQYLLNSLCATTDISAEYIKMACTGHFSEPLLQIFDTIEAGALLEAILHELKIGHSSGCDTLAGLLWFILTEKERTSNGNIQ